MPNILLFVLLLTQIPVPVTSRSLPGGDISMARYELTEASRQQLKEQQLFRCRNPLLADVVERNINTMVQMRREMERSKTFQDRVADAITAFSGSMVFIYLHIAWF